MSDGYSDELKDYLLRRKNKHTAVTTLNAGWVNWSCYERSVGLKEKKDNENGNDCSFGKNATIA